MKRLLCLPLLLVLGAAPPVCPAEPPAITVTEVPQAKEAAKTPPPKPPADDEAYVRLPATLACEVGDLTSITADTNCKALSWKLVPRRGASLIAFKSEPLAVFSAKTPGEYIVICIGADKATPFAECVITVTGPQPPPVPPGPTPPGPNPPGPTPGPAPLPGPGFKAMIILETSDLSKLPSKQVSVVTAKAVRDYLNAKTTPTTDGGKRGWYIVDQNISMEGESKVWQDALKRPRTQLPWIILSDGVSGYEGALPEDVNATMTLLKRFGG